MTTIGDAARAASIQSVIKARVRRLEPPARLPGVDLARGLAVIGMFAAHLLVTTTLEWGSPSTWTGIVDGRSSILFATLAGLALGLTVGPDGARQTGRELFVTRRQLGVRAVLIWALGIALVTLSVPVNVILPAYGLLFVIGIGFIALSTRSLVVIAAVLVVVMPFVVGGINEVVDETNRFAIMIGWHYPFLLWAAFVAAGIAAGRLLVTSSRGAVTLLGVGAALAVVGYGVLGPIGERAAEGDDAAVGSGQWLLTLLEAGPHSSGMGEAVGSGGFALAAIGLCTLIGMTALRWVFWPVRAMGSMPLTAYTAHLVVWAGWIAVAGAGDPGLDPMDDFRALDPFWPMTLGVMAFCVLWALVVGRGPLETAMAWASTTVSEKLAPLPPSPPRPRPGDDEAVTGTVDPMTRPIAMDPKTEPILLDRVR